jgi:hypothetical protein
METDLKQIDKSDWERRIVQIEDGQYTAAVRALEAVTERFVLPEADTLKVNAVLMDLYRLLDRIEPTLDSFFARSAVWRLRELQGQPGAWERLCTLHEIANKVVKHSSMTHAQVVLPKKNTTQSILAVVIEKEVGATLTKLSRKARTRKAKAQTYTHVLYFASQPGK